MLDAVSKFYRIKLIYLARHQVENFANSAHCWFEVNRQLSRRAFPCTHCRYSYGTTFNVMTNPAAQP